MNGASAELCSATLEGDLARLTWKDGFEGVFALAWLLDNALSGEAGVGGHRIRTARDLVDAGDPARLSVRNDHLSLSLAKDVRLCAGPVLRAFAEALDSAGSTATRTPWPRGADMADRPAIPFPDYLTHDLTLERALGDVVTFGLVRLVGAGADSEVVDRAVARFGHIRETNYGRRFEVRTLTAPDHLAYTNRALEPHTDNPYRDPAPTLQLLHCRRNAGAGGATYFVDGLALAEDLRREDPDAFLRLATRQVPFAYRAASGAVYEARSPAIRLDADGAVRGLRVNHRALGQVDFAPVETALWYRAYLRFVGAADAPDRRVTFHLAPGDLVIFDNERLLHGRTEITGPADRLLEGCYADRDGLLATLARLRTSGHGL
jgi:gamma-butyrobetaine dioxygenase